MCDLYVLLACPRRKRRGYCEKKKTQITHEKKTQIPRNVTRKQAVPRDVTTKQPKKDTGNAKQKDTDNAKKKDTDHPLTVQGLGFRVWG